MQINRQAFISQPAGNGNMQIEKVLIKDLIASQDKIMLNKISGLILCGGNSSRMQEDKAFLKYH